MTMPLDGSLAQDEPEITAGRQVIFTSVDRIESGFNKSAQIPDETRGLLEACSSAETVQGDGLESVTTIRSHSIRAKQNSRMLKGFYAYSIASETFAIVSLTLFLPILLEQIARENGYLEPDHSIKCPPSSSGTPSYGSSFLSHGVETVEDGPTRCAVRLLGHWVDTASFSLFTYSASVAVQALTVISMGGLADDPVIRHRLLTTFAVAGSSFTIAFILLPSSSPWWPLAAFLTLGANVSFGASIVCMNSYLPELGKTSEDVWIAWDALQNARKALRESSVSHSRASSFEQSRQSSTAVETLNGDPEEPYQSRRKLSVAQQSYVQANDQYVQERSLATSHVSSRALAAGYAAGISLLLVLLIPVTLMRGSTWSLRCAIAGSGIFWAMGTIPASFWLRPLESSRQSTADQPGSSTYSAHSVNGGSTTASLLEGWRGLRQLLTEWKRLPSAFLYLGAWFLLSDSFSTVSSTAMLFAKTTLSMSTSGLIVIAAITPSSAIAGAVLFPRLQRRTSSSRYGNQAPGEGLSGWSNIEMLRLLVGLVCFVPVWGMIWLRQSWQMYLLAIYYGAIAGSFQAYARTCFSEIVPPSQAARWFGLYSITDKSSSFLGPLLVAIITNITGQIRYGFVLILFGFLSALPLLFKVNMDQGRMDAETYEKVSMEANVASLLDTSDTEGG